MRRLTLLVVIFITASFKILQAQQIDIQELLVKSNKAVAAVNEGSYVLRDYYSKVSVGEDSSSRIKNIRCYFKRLSKDTLTGYKLASLRDDGYERTYDGQEFLELYEKTLEVTHKDKYPKRINKLQNDYLIFPFLKFLNNNIQYSSNVFQITGQEEVNGNNCYKIQQVVKNTDKQPESYSCYYISSSTFLPVRWYTKLITIVGKSRTEQTFDILMGDLKKEKVPDSVFTKKVLSGYSRVKEYDPNEDKHPIPLLAAGNPAPQWELPLLSGGTLKLSDLKGKIVVMDFWYKACTPCQQQMIELETISSKFSNDKVAFVGINTIDDPEKEKLVTFLKNRNISILSVYNGKSIKKLYQIYAELALFVIDKDGKIIYALDGFSYTLSEDLSRIIQAAL